MKRELLTFNRASCLGRGSVISVDWANNQILADVEYYDGIDRHFKEVTVECNYNGSLCGWNRDRHQTVADNQKYLFDQCANSGATIFIPGDEFLYTTKTVEDVTTYYVLAKYPEATFEKLPPWPVLPALVQSLWVVHPTSEEAVNGYNQPFVDDDNISLINSFTDEFGLQRSGGTISDVVNKSLLVKSDSKYVYHQAYEYDFHNDISNALLLWEQSTALEDYVINFEQSSGYIGINGIKFFDVSETQFSWSYMFKRYFSISTIDEVEIPWIVTVGWIPYSGSFLTFIGVAISNRIDESFCNREHLEKAINSQSVDRTRTYRRFYDNYFTAPVSATEAQSVFSNTWVNVTALSHECEIRIDETGPLIKWYSLFSYAGGVLRYELACVLISISIDSAGVITPTIATPVALSTPTLTSSLAPDLSWATRTISGTHAALMSEKGVILYADVYADYWQDYGTHRTWEDQKITFSGPSGEITAIDGGSGEVTGYTGAWYAVSTTKSQTDLTDVHWMHLDLDKDFYIFVEVELINGTVTWTNGVGTSQDITLRLYAYYQGAKSLISENVIDASKYSTSSDRRGAGSWLPTYDSFHYFECLQGVVAEFSASRTYDLCFDILPYMGTGPHLMVEERNKIYNTERFFTHHVPLETVRTSNGLMWFSWDSLKIVEVDNLIVVKMDNPITWEHERIFWTSDDDLHKLMLTNVGNDEHTNRCLI